MPSLSAYLREASWWNVCQKHKIEVDDKFSSCTIAAYVDISSNGTSMAEKCLSSTEVIMEEIFSGIANVRSKL